MSVGTYKDAIRLANIILEAANSPCGCVSLFSESTSTTIRYGTCTSICQKFVGCPRHNTEDHECECDGKDEKHCQDSRNYQ
jgi:hypothetical protein